MHGRHIEIMSLYTAHPRHYGSISILEGLEDEVDHKYFIGNTARSLLSLVSHAGYDL